MKPVTIRQARREDTDAVVAMARALARHVGDDPTKSVAERFSRDCFEKPPWFECLVAECDGALVGFITYSRAAEVHTAGRRLWIGDLYVAPEARRSQVASQLMHGVVARARELECRTIYWELWHGNLVGSAFFEKLHADVVDDVEILRFDVDRA